MVIGLTVNQLDNHHLDQKRLEHAPNLSACFTCMEKIGARLISFQLVDVRRPRTSHDRPEVFVLAQKLSYGFDV